MLEDNKKKGIKQPPQMVLSRTLATINGQIVLMYNVSPNLLLRMREMDEPWQQPASLNTMCTLWAKCAEAQRVQLLRRAAKRHRQTHGKSARMNDMLPVI